MLFIHPMWDHESERIGKQRCTPIGYALHGIAELIGFLGLLLLPAVPAVLVWRWFAGTFHASLWWLFAVTFGLGVVSEVLFRLSWRMALRRGFQYDYKSCTASWLEAGKRRTYKYPADLSAATDDCT